MPISVIATVVTGYHFEDNLGSDSTARWMRFWCSRKRREFLNQLDSSNVELRRKLRYIHDESERVRFHDISVINYYPNLGLYWRLLVS